MHIAAVIFGVLLVLMFGSLTIATITSNRWLRTFGWMPQRIGAMVFLVAYLAATALGAFLIYWGLT
jgi:hypothetical protein